MLAKDNQMELVCHVSGIALPWERTLGPGPPSHAGQGRHAQQSRVDREATQPQDTLGS